MHPVTFLKNNSTLIWRILWGLFLIPALLLLWRYFNGTLGINPLQKLERTTGNFALLFLIITLSITPARFYLSLFCKKIKAKDGKRLADWNWLMRSRRMIGMYCFFYAVIHVSIYFSLDLAFEWKWLVSDIKEKPFIIAGMLTMLLLIPLAITSTNKMMHRLGKNWRRIHKLIYIISITAIIHYWWLSKVGVYDAWLYSLLVILLLTYRLFVKTGLINPNPADDGMEADEKARIKPDIYKQATKQRQLK